MSGVYFTDANPWQVDVSGWEWTDQAACAGEDVNLFFGVEGERPPESTIREEKAKAICRGCPVRSECLEHALAKPERHGIWAGLDLDERKKERRGRQRRATDQAA